MAKPKTIPQQRKELYKAIAPEIERIVAKHGFDATRMVVNRWLNATRFQLSIRKKKAELEAQLVAMEAKLR